MSEGPEGPSVALGPAFVLRKPCPRAGPEPEKPQVKSRDPLPLRCGRAGRGSAPAGPSTPQGLPLLAVFARTASAVDRTQNLPASPGGLATHGVLRLREGVPSVPRVRPRKLQAADSA